WSSSGRAGDASIGPDHVARTAHRMKKRLLEALLDLAAQPGNVDIDDIGLGIKVIVPDILEQHGARHHLPGMTHQIFEQTELARLEGDFLPVPCNAVGEAVEFEIANLVDCIDILRPTPAVQ